MSNQRPSRRPGIAPGRHSICDENNPLQRALTQLEEQGYKEEARMASTLIMEWLLYREAAHDLLGAVPPEAREEATRRHPILRKQHG